MSGRKSGFILALSLMLLAAGTACGANNGEMKGQSYDRDGLLGTTSANPNLPINPTYHNYATDVKLLKDSIAQIDGVQDSTIVLNGATAYVTLELRDDLDIEESMRIRNAAQASLQRMMPRYDVRVSVGKNRLFQ